MAEVSIKEQVEKLVILQKIDKKIYDLKQDAKEKPLMIEGLKEEFEGKKAHLKALEEQLKKIQLSRKECELELQTKEEAVTKANAQLSQIKTNKEYTAKMTEIASIKADQSLVEEKILISYDEADAAMAEVDKEKTIVAEEEKVFLAKKLGIEAEINGITIQIKELETKRIETAPSIDPRVLERYDRILAKKDGLAIVPIHRSNCGGCFMDVTAQAINAVKLGEDFVYCERCSRMLYLEDES